jgi:hypothetical protein
MSMDLDIKDVAAVLDRVGKPRSLVAAETRLKLVREQRAEVDRRFKAAIASNWSPTLDKPAASRDEVHRLDAELEVADSVVIQARTELRLQQQAFAPIFRAAMAPCRAAAAAEILAGIECVARGAAILNAIDRAGAQSGVEAGSVQIPNLHYVVPELQRVAGKAWAPATEAFAEAAD